MNPRVVSKCACRALVVLTAATGLFLATGCGSNSIPKPNTQGFGNGSLSGTYVFSSEGADSSNAGNLLALAGAFTADGSGNIKTGTMDVIDPGLALASPVAQPITSGSYNVSTDGRGKATLTTSVGKFTLDFVLTAGAGGPSSASTHGLVTEFDGNGSGSGTIDLQTAVTGLSQLAGPYAFSVAGADGNGFPFASAGAFTLGSGGTSTAGVGDFNDDGGLSNDQALTATATLGSGTGPGSIAMSSGFGGLTFDFYPIDATHWKLIETDGLEFLAGDVFTQNGASFPGANSVVVFTMGGAASAGPVTVGGLMTSTDGLGNFGGGLEDANIAGTLSSQLPFTGALVVVPGEVNGRTVVNLSGFTPAAQWVLYPSGGGLLMLEMDAVGVTTGAAFVQSATSFTTGPAGYGFNMTGANPSSEVDDIAQFNAATATSNNMTGVLDENQEGFASSTSGFTGTYTPDPTATGRGEIVIPGLKTALGGLTLEYYVVDSGTAVFIEVDGNPNPQVGLGTFELQGTSAVAPAAHAAAFGARPMGRAHGAFRRR